MPRPRSFDEDAVLTAVCTQFGRSGYAATSLEDLMTVTGLGKGSLYGAFGDKRQLFLRALEVNRERQLAMMRASLCGGGGSPLANLRDHLVRLATGPTGAERFGCMLINSAAELGEEDAEVRERVEGTFAATVGLIADTLAAAVAEGELSPELDTTVQARLLLTTTQGAELLRRSGVDDAGIAEVVTAAVRNLPRPAVLAPASG